MSENRTLLYLGSKNIEQYIAQHPIHWHDRDAAGRGGLGDSAGVPPTPAVQEFLALLLQRQDLFTQQEYTDFCFNQWNNSEKKDWVTQKTKPQRYGLTAKCFRNWYPSMIDSLHVYSLLVESKAFTKCILDSYVDACSKQDLLVSSDNRPLFAINLFWEGALNNRKYKNAHRSSAGTPVSQAFDVPLPKSRPTKRPGNKRWYCIKDFEPIFHYISNHDSLWDMPIVPCTCGYHVKRTGVA